MEFYGHVNMFQYLTQWVSRIQRSIGQHIPAEECTNKEEEEQEKQFVLLS